MPNKKEHLLQTPIVVIVPEWHVDPSPAAMVDYLLTPLRRLGFKKFSSEYFINAYKNFSNKDWVELKSAMRDFFLKKLQPLDIKFGDTFEEIKTKLGPDKINELMNKAVSKGEDPHTGIKIYLNFFADERKTEVFHKAFLSGYELTVLDTVAKSISDSEVRILNHNEDPSTGSFMQRRDDGMSAAITPNTIVNVGSSHVKGIIERLARDHPDWKIVILNVTSSISKSAEETKGVTNIPYKDTAERLGISVIDLDVGKVSSPGFEAVIAQKATKALKGIKQVIGQSPSVAAQSHYLKHRKFFQHMCNHQIKVQYQKQRARIAH